MKTALRLAVCVMMAAAARAAVARSPASNGTGDGEANVPFASLQEQARGAEDVGGGSGEPGRAAESVATAAQPLLAQSPASNGTGDGEANVPFASLQEQARGAEDVGGGSGEPGRAEVVARQRANEATARAEADREFERMVWTAP